VVLSDKRNNQCNLPVSPSNPSQRLSPLSHLTFIVLLFGLLSGCALLPQPPIEPPVDSAPSAERLDIAADADSVPFRIATAELTIKTYRGGWLPGISHNHVMTTDKLGGVIHLSEDRSKSRAIAYFRPYDLVLDDPTTRQQAGIGFESERSEQDILATRTRMLGPAGFASNDYPFVLIRIEPVSLSEVNLEIGFREGIYHHQLPLAWELVDGTLNITGQFKLTHSQLGLKPYSALAGAIGVADDVDVEIVLSAIPE